VPAKPGYFQLQTAFLESKSKCLEGNQVAQDSLAWWHRIHEYMFGERRHWPNVENGAGRMDEPALSRSERLLPWQQKALDAPVIARLCWSGPQRSPRRASSGLTAAYLNMRRPLGRTWVGSLKHLQRTSLGGTQK